MFILFTAININTTLPVTFESIVHSLIFLLNGFSVLVVVIGVVKSLYHFLAYEMRRIFQHKETNEVLENNRIKQELGSYILLSLEILIAADIIGSILNPTMEDILMLGAIVIIRTIISYFLGKEVMATKA